MSLDQATTLSRDETDAILSRHETGVLALARADEPYAIPVSYGYDAAEGQFFMRLVSTPDSEKRRFLASSPAGRLVVYEEEDPVYRSVLAAGTLDRIDREDLTVDHVEQFGEAKRPLFEIWGEGRPALEVELYVIDPETVSGREIRVDRSADAT